MFRFEWVLQIEPEFYKALAFFEKMLDSVIIRLGLKVAPIFIPVCLYLRMIKWWLSKEKISIIFLNSPWKFTKTNNKSYQIRRRCKKISLDNSSRGKSYHSWKVQYSNNEDSAVQNNRERYYQSKRQMNWNSRPR